MSMIGNFVAVSDARLAELLARPDRIAAFLAEDDAAGRRALDVDKAWHAIHFLLCGEPWGGAWPEGFIVTGGEPVGDVDVGYGPARGFTSAEVKEIDGALRGVDAPALLARWDVEAVRAADIYGVRPDAVEEEAEYVGSYYEQLAAFVRALAEAGLGMLVYVN